MVTQLAVRYLSLSLPERQKDSPGRVATAFMPPVDDIYGDVAPYMPPTDNSV